MGLVHVMLIHDSPRSVWYISCVRKVKVTSYFQLEAFGTIVVGQYKIQASYVHGFRSWIIIIISSSVPLFALLSRKQEQEI
jgi:hypothetical protein